MYHDDENANWKVLGQRHMHLCPTGRTYDKDTFYEHLLTCILLVEDSKIHVVAGDFTGHVGKESVTFDTYGGKGYGTLNHEGLSIRSVYCNWLCSY